MLGSGTSPRVHLSRLISGERVPDVCRRGIAAAFLWIASTALGAVEGPGRMQLIWAVRVSKSPSIDGKLDEPQWLTAPVFDKFAQSFPNEGAPPSERTEVRVLYESCGSWAGATTFRPPIPSGSPSIQVTIIAKHLLSPSTPPACSKTVFGFRTIRTARIGMRFGRPLFPSAPMGGQRNSPFR